jgi:hypothetical protein
VGSTPTLDTKNKNLPEGSFCFVRGVRCRHTLRVGFERRSDVFPAGKTASRG